jgi:hypothetical protein
VGLLLSIDTSLSRDQVQQILRTSAVRDLGWKTIDTTNPDDRMYYGYGKLSGLRAISTLLRGDCNATGTINIGDVTYLMNYLFSGGPEPFPDKIYGDANCNGRLNVSDLTFLLNYLTGGGPAPAKPCHAF